MSRDSELNTFNHWCRRVMQVGSFVSCLAGVLQVLRETAWSPVQLSRWNVSPWVGGERYRCQPPAIKTDHSCVWKDVKQFDSEYLLHRRLEAPEELTFNHHLMNYDDFIIANA